MYIYIIIYIYIYVYIYIYTLYTYTKYDSLLFYDLCQSMHLWGFIWIFHSSNFLENNASLTLLILGTFSKTGTFETVRSHQVQELVIKKYRKEDKNFEAPERARAGAFKSIK